MARVMGIDVGSRTSKGVILRGGMTEARHMLPSGVNYKTIALRLREELLEKAGLSCGDIFRTVSTGRGAGLIPFSDQYAPDIICCAGGINHLFPDARMIIDIQAQSSHVIRVDEKGQVINFAASEVCASGSGSFIEVIANVLQMKLEDIGTVSLNSKNPVTFTTGCAVFGESEAVSRVSEGIPGEDILAGVHKALADKIFALIDRVGLKEPCVMSGGCGLNAGLIKSIEERGIRLLLPDQPQMVNAIGAAVIAEEADC